MSATMRIKKGDMVQIIAGKDPIDASNVMYLYNGKPARIQYQIVDGKKVRAAKVKDQAAVVID